MKKRFRITSRTWSGDIEVQVQIESGSNLTRVVWASEHCSHLTGLTMYQVKKMCLTNGWSLEVLSTLSGKERQLTSAANEVLG